MARFGSAALIAGGKSRRMGGFDKQGIDVDGEALGPRLASKLLRHFEEVIVVTQEPSLYEGRGLRCVPDAIPGKGPLSGIHAALLASNSDWCYVVACDMPRFNPEYAAYLVARTEKALGGLSGGLGPSACVTCFGAHIEPFHALYSRSLLTSIERLLNGTERDASGRECSVMDLLRSEECVWIEEEEARFYTPDWDLFFNVNDPADLAVYRSAPMSTFG
jgi:molybdopterin-guanine dinucleotide biosynthesis protein A